MAEFVSRRGDAFWRRSNKAGSEGGLVASPRFFFFFLFFPRLLFPGPSSHGNRPRTDNTHSACVDPADRKLCLLHKSSRLLLLGLLGENKTKKMLLFMLKKQKKKRDFLIPILHLRRIMSSLEQLDRGAFKCSDQSSSSGR